MALTLCPVLRWMLGKKISALGPTEDSSIWRAKVIV